MASKLTHLKRRGVKNNILIGVCLGSAERTALHTYRPATLSTPLPLTQYIFVVSFNFSTSYSEKNWYFFYFFSLAEAILCRKQISI
jgi:hypothetical protein